MSRATSKGNEAKLKTKQPSDMPTPRFEHGGSDLWSNTLLLDYGGAQPALWMSPDFINAIEHRLYNTYGENHAQIQD